MKLFNLLIALCLFGFGKANSQTQKTFSDPLDTAVFTTKFVLNDKKDITWVSHDKADGAWQFFSNDRYEHYEDIAKVVGLGQILKTDPTLYELADLPLGYKATRKDIHSKWKIEKQD